MVAAAHVNVHYLLILLLPSVIAVVMVALTWYYRAGRRGDPGAKPGRPSDEEEQRRLRREVGSLLRREVESLLRREVESLPRREVGSPARRQAAPQVARRGTNVDVLVGFDAVPWR